MSDLLHIFLRLTLNEAETSPHSQLDLTQLSNHSIFALQLLHRWCIRTVICSKFHKKPPTKCVPINLYVAFMFAFCFAFKQENSFKTELIEPVAAHERSERKHSESAQQQCARVSRVLGEVLERAGQRCVQTGE